MQPSVFVNQLHYLQWCLPFQCLLLLLLLIHYPPGLGLVSSVISMTPPTAPATAAKSLQSWSDSVRPRPWDSPGKNTGVGCHFLFQCIKVKSENEVTQLCPPLRDPMDCSLPGSSSPWDFPGKGTGVGCHCLLCQLLLPGLKPPVSSPFTPLPTVLDLRTDPLTTA